MTRVLLALSVTLPAAAALLKARRDRRRANITPAPAGQGAPPALRLATPTAGLRDTGASGKDLDRRRAETLRLIWPPPRSAA